MYKSNSNYPLKLYCLHFNECDPKKCTSIKLRNFNLLKFIKGIKGKYKNALLLDPFANKTISKEDRSIIINHGLIVIDCSWKNLLKFQKIKVENARKVPKLIAANPINYGKWEKLSSVEAIAAALFITGFVEESYFLLNKFKWGSEFLRLNKKRLKESK
ncbi:MAG: DUF367 family protein [Promethearchaeota archaeon]|nr:MAG: DUF367 family protein [Candidatus Lokiarchaeota archaeon]